MALIEELLRARVAPAVDGLFRLVGQSHQALVDGPGLTRLEIGAPLAPAGWDADADSVLELDPADRAALAGGGSVCCGEGPLGSDGFFARAGADDAVLWVVVLTRSNPFVRAEVDGTKATFTNNLGNTLTVDLTDPRFAA